MKKESKNLYMKYKLNPNAKYNDEELREIRASEFAISLLMPRIFVLAELIKLGIDKSMYINKCDREIAYLSIDLSSRMAKTFVVEEKDAFLRLYDLLYDLSKRNELMESMFVKDLLYFYNDDVSFDKILKQYYPDISDLIKKYLDEEFNINSKQKISKCKVLIDKKMNNQTIEKNV